MASQHPDLDSVLTDWANWPESSNTTVNWTIADQYILSEKIVTVLQERRGLCGSNR